MRDLDVARRSGSAARVGGPVRAAVLVVGFATLLAVNVRSAEHAPTPAPVPLGHGTVPETLVSGPAPEPQPLRGGWDPAFWRSEAIRSIDRTTLAGAVAVPEGANVFAAQVVGGGPSPAYMLYEAGGGAFSSDFYPASSIKVLAAVGALELAYASGFTGEAVVDGAYSLESYYDAAIRYSSNEDYDALVRMAGVAWLNEHFLPSEGYRSTRIQEAYAGGEGVTESPAVHLAEDGRELNLPERAGGDDYGCAMANCSTLFDLVDSVRRVVLDGELAPEERFAIAPADVAGLQEALLGADSWIGPGVAEALGPGARLYSKPGWTSGLDCVDIGFVVDPATERRYLIGVSAPDDGECVVLATMAAEILTVLAHDTEGEARRTDGSVVRVVDGRQRP